MRILEVSSYMPPHQGGLERAVAILVEGLCQRGHDVRWIASATPERPGATGVFIRVPAWNLVEWMAIPWPAWSVGALARLAQEIRRADVVHIHDCLYMSSAAAVALARERGVPVLLTQHIGPHTYNPLLNAIQHLAYRTLGRIVIDAADRLFGVSPHVADWFRSIGVRRPFTIAPYGAEDHRFGIPDPGTRRRCRTLWGIEADASVLLFVGRLVPLKGLARLLKAHRELAREGVRLVVAGNGPDRALLAGAERVIHFSHVPTERMPEIYALADVFALPSRGEGFSTIAVQEAMLSGLPVVVSDDPAFVVNLTGAPAVTFARTDDDLLASIRHYLEQPPPKEPTSEWARAQWDRDRYFGLYEEALLELARCRRIIGYDQNMMSRPTARRGTP